jgi:transmembrane sensor
MKTKLAEELLEKYEQGRCTADEQVLVELWFQSLESKALEMDAKEKAALSVKMKTEIDKGNGFSKLYRNSLWSGFTLPRIAAAAAVLLVVGLGVFFYTSSRHLEGSVATRDLANDIKPGGNKAYLILSNGKRLSLTDAANGALAKEAGVEITKTADGQVIYTAKGPSLPAASLPGGAGGSVGANSDGIKYSNALNTIETPRGGQYQIRLPDGSKVWLNAASKLIYPVSFNGRGQRVVELSGEAYFEIFKNKLQPFVVKSKNQEVTVLGTHFNVNSYTDEGSVKTTLLEGSVKVNQDILKPGEQSNLVDGKITIKDVDVSLAIAWKNGLFAYKNAPLETVMQQIARWYDVDIVYTNPQTKLQTFSGTVSRYDNVSKILKAIEYTGSVKFKMEGRKIIAN